MICVFEKNAAPRPVRFRMQRRDGSCETVSVDQVKQVEEFQPGGQHSYIYTCASDRGEYVITYQLKYIVKDMRWMILGIL